MKLLKLPIIAAMLLLGLDFSTRAFAADTYKVDPVHSFVIFRIKHLNVSYAYGQFQNPAGTIVVDEEDASKSSFDIEIQAEKVDTHQEGRDKHLKGPDFFDVKQFPTITFKSTAVKKTSDTAWEVTGDLTLHGVTKSITVNLDRTGTGPGMKPGVTLAGFETTFTIKRSEFGMAGMLQAIGDEVRLTVAFEADKQ